MQAPAAVPKLVTLSELALLLGDTATARALVARIKVASRAGERLYAWRDLEPLLDRNHLRIARAQARRVRLARRTSKHWLAGYPELVAEWHPTKNGNAYPDEVRYASSTSVWWRCTRGPDHEWGARVANRTVRGAGCPFCAGLRVSVTNSLAACRPEIAREWHPTKNGSVTPANVVKCSASRAWWKCPAGPDHEWEATIHSRTSRASACPFCLRRRVSVTTSLATEAPHLAREWHPRRNGRLRPTDVTSTIARRVWWRCTKCGHAWETTVRNRSVRGGGCPDCTRQARARSSSCT